MPVTTPAVETVAVPVALLAHAPPGVTSLRVMVEPTQVDEGPDIAAGDAVTVKVPVTVQPVPSE